jgi:hypothetical protein
MTAAIATVVLTLAVSIVQADGGPWGSGGGGSGGGGRWNGGRFGYGDDGDGNGNGGDFGSADNGFGFGSLANLDRANAILIAHAVLASAVWVLFVPWAALLLRLNIESPVVLKLHAIFQILSLIVFIAAAGLG